MDLREWTRVAVLPATLFVFVVVFVIPNLRHRLRTGEWAIVMHQEKAGAQRILGVWMIVVHGGAFAWSGAYAIFGPKELGSWPVPAWIPLAGWTIAVAGVCIVVWAQVQMGSSWRIGIDSRRTDLVTGGFFSVVRNPIYTGIVSVVAGLACVAPGPWIVMIAVQAAMLVGVMARLEEQHLVATHGERYLAYARRTGRFFPGLGKLATPHLADKPLDAANESDPDRADAAPR